MKYDPIMCMMVDDSVKTKDGVSKADLNSVVDKLTKGLNLIYKDPQRAASEIMSGIIQLKTFANKI